jgi:hypothetical protein
LDGSFTCSTFARLKATVPYDEDGMGGETKRKKYSWVNPLEMTHELEMLQHFPALSKEKFH